MISVYRIKKTAKEKSRDFFGDPGRFEDSRIFFEKDSSLKNTSPRRNNGYL